MSDSLGTEASILLFCTVRSLDRMAWNKLAYFTMRAD